MANPPTTVDTIKPGVKDEGMSSSASISNNVTFLGEDSSAMTGNATKEQHESIASSTNLSLPVERFVAPAQAIQHRKRNSINSVENIISEDEQLVHANGLILEAAPTAAMDVLRLETTSSVAATGPPSTSSYRSILSNYSGSDDENGLADAEDENGNVQVVVATDNGLTSSQTSTSTPTPIPIRAQRVQAQLVHQRRLQNAASKTAGPRNSAAAPTLEVIGKEELQGLLDTVTLKFDKAVQDIVAQQRKDFDRVISLVQAESQKRSTIESRLHAQLLLQSESMIAMELKLLRLEAKLQQKDQKRTSMRLHPVIDEEEDFSYEDEEVPPRTTHVLSSAASLVSAVTATSGFEDVLHHDEEYDEEEQETLEEETNIEESSVEAGGAPVDRDGDTHSESTAPSAVPSRQPSESILLNPIPPIQHQASVMSVAESTRALRPAPPDEGSSLGTSVTTSTLPSTVVTASNPNAARSSFPRGRSAEVEVYLSGNAPRSRSQSPLTVPSMTASLVPSIASTAITTNAVASSREFRSRRNISSLASNTTDQTRSLTNRVVSFVADDDNAAPQASNELLDSASMADTLTLPDEIDNVSDIADAFAASSNRWREEYEARLDAVQKRFSRD